MTLTSIHLNNMLLKYPLIVRKFILLPLPFEFEILYFHSQNFILMRYIFMFDSLLLIISSYFSFILIQSSKWFLDIILSSFFGFKYLFLVMACLCSVCLDIFCSTRFLILMHLVYYHFLYGLRISVSSLKISYLKVINIIYVFF